MNEVVLTQDLSSGRVHKRYRMPGGNLATYEGCNLDDAGDYTVVTIDGEGISAAETMMARIADGWSRVIDRMVTIPFALCRNCFPEDDGSTWPE